MSSLPRNLPSLLRDAGLKVVEVDNWQGHGRPGAFGPVGVLNHHTGSSAKGWSLAKELAYARWMFRTGRSDLPAPLCQIALGRSGVVYVGASGRANHAGTAKASGSVSGGDGNKLYVGIEWMLSGTEDIPAVMLQAGIKLNAVITEKVTKTSAMTVSCHYQTSATGKWDIGDPNGVRFKNVRVLDVGKFRAAVASARDELYRPDSVERPSMDHVYVWPGHFSGQFSDSPKQWRHDLDAVLARGHDWITGTEAASTKVWAAVKRMAKKHGYIRRRHGSNWVLVKKAIYKRGSFRWGGQTVVDRKHVHGMSGDLGFVWAAFTHKTPGVGRIGVIASHYPIKAYPRGTAAKQVNLDHAKTLAAAIGKKATELGKGKGKALVFYGGDQNIVDRHNDTFFGGPFISSWDELKKWPNTGHGNIDVIARLKSDRRVECVGGRAFTDRDLFLYTDHHFIQARYRITLARKAKS